MLPVIALDYPFTLQIYQKTFKINGMADIYSSKYVARV